MLRNCGAEWPLLLDDKLTILRTYSRRWRVGSAIGLLTIAAGLSLVTLTPPEPLQAEDPPQTAEKPADIKTNFRPAVPVADSDEENSSFNATLVLASPPSDTDSSDAGVVKADAPSTTVAALSDKEKQEILRPHYKRLRDARQPNIIFGLCIDEMGKPLEGVLVEVFTSRNRSREQNGKPILSTRSDAKGEYRFDDFFDIKKEFPNGPP